ncbi:MAG: hypothetical protein WBL80_03340 [Erysipelotrichaceae bacterium]
MTCIVGIVKGNKVIIGADKLGVFSDSYQKINLADKKIFKRGEFIFGVCGSPRMAQLIQYKLDIPPLSEKQDVTNYMVSNFVENVRTTFKNGGFAEIEKNVESGGTFMVGFRGRLFVVYGDFQICESTEPYTSIGCGQRFALGAMKTAIDSGETEPMLILRKGLESAHYFSAGVGGEFDFVETEEEKTDDLWMLKPVQ